MICRHETLIFAKVSHGPIDIPTAGQVDSTRRFVIWRGQGKIRPDADFHLDVQVPEKEFRLHGAGEGGSGKARISGGDIQ